MVLQFDAHRPRAKKTAKTSARPTEALSSMLCSLLRDLRRLEQVDPIAVAAIHKVAIRQIRQSTDDGKAGA